MVKILIGVVVVTIAVIGAFLFLDPKSGINSSSGANVTEVSDSNQITITVEGEVYKPGTYTLAEGATMNDLLTAASGVTSNADAKAYYETAILKKHGLVLDGSFQIINGISVYPVMFFNAKSLYSGEMKITEETVSVHHCSWTWAGDKSKL